MGNFANLQVRWQTGCFMKSRQCIHHTRVSTTGHRLSSNFLPLSRKKVGLCQIRTSAHKLSSQTYNWLTKVHLAKRWTEVVVVKPSYNLSVYNLFTSAPNQSWPARVSWRTSSGNLTRKSRFALWLGITTSIIWLQMLNTCKDNKTEYHNAINSLSLSQPLSVSVCLSPGHSTLTICLPCPDIVLTGSQGLCTSQDPSFHQSCPIQ